MTVMQILSRPDPNAPTRVPRPPAPGAAPDHPASSWEEMTAHREHFEERFAILKENHIPANLAEWLAALLVMPRPDHIPTKEWGMFVDDCAFFVDRANRIQGGEKPAMARPCSVCTHKARNAIDKGLVAGEPFRALERQFGVSRDALRRHKADHIPAVVAQAQQAAVVAQGDTLLDQLGQLQESARRLGEKAEKEKKFGVALMAVRELVRIVELMAKLKGELQEGRTVNVLVMPEWVTIRTTIIKALEPYPEARGVVVEALTHAGG
ncbi:MAG: hypothetical protein HQL64_11695 [Magnetococcales bacterium]|nr:hypothetical protein [Magnetococcales bacterium]